MLLNGDKMEPVAARRIVAPQRPGADKVQAQAEPVSTIVNTRRARQRSGRPLPFRKTWRVCPKQPAALWYTSPNFNEYRTPSLRMANLAGSIKGVMIGRSPCEQTPHWRGQTILMEFA